LNSCTDCCQGNERAIDLSSVTVIKRKRVEQTSTLPGDDGESHSVPECVCGFSKTASDLADFKSGLLSRFTPTQREAKAQLAIGRMAAPTCIEILPGVCEIQKMALYFAPAALVLITRRSHSLPLFLSTPASRYRFRARAGNLYLAASGKEGLAELKLLLQQHIVAVRTRARFFLARFFALSLRFAHRPGPLHCSSKRAYSAGSFRCSHIRLLFFVLESTLSRSLCSRSLSFSPSFTLCPSLSHHTRRCSTGRKW
jgi:hypothetical protein